jgi:hypothetical protein
LASVLKATKLLMIFVGLHITSRQKLYQEEGISLKPQIFGRQGLYFINWQQEHFHSKELMINFCIEKYVEDNCSFQNTWKARFRKL